MPDKTAGGEPLDRQEYLKEVREGLLEKLGLPKTTRPDQVARVMAIKTELEKLKKNPA